jgi:hypothetical protein
MHVWIRPLELLRSRNLTQQVKFRNSQVNYSGPRPSLGRRPAITLRGNPTDSLPSNGSQQVKKVRRRTETGEAPRWQGSTTENTGSI